MLGLELFDFYKDAIRTVYFAHANSFAVFVSWFSITAPLTILFIKYEDFLVAFTLGFGI